MIKDLRNREKVRQSFVLIVVYGGLAGVFFGSIIGIVLIEQSRNGEFNLATLGFLAVVGLVLGGGFGGLYFVINKYINKNPELATQKQNGLALIVWGIAAALTGLITVVIQNLTVAGIIGILLYAILVCIFGDAILYYVKEAKRGNRRFPRMGFFIGACIGIPIIGRMILDFVTTLMPNRSFEGQIIFATFAGLVLGLICGAIWIFGISLNRFNKGVAFVFGLILVFVLLNIFNAM